MNPSKMIVVGTVVTMDADRRIIADGAVAFSDHQITEVGQRDEVIASNPDAAVVGRPGDLITPGYINAHQHLTGDRLVQSAIPDDLAPGESIFTWVVPVHGEHQPADDLLTATLTLTESVCNGVTTTVEAGTVAHPDAVAEGANRVGARITLGTWGWDIEEGPFTGSVDQVIEWQQAVLDGDYGPLVTPWVTLVGHDLMSDELLVAASTLAREAGTGLTFHLSPSTSDPEQYLSRTGRRPVEHLADLGVLGPELLIAHGVHLDDSEVDLIVSSRTAVASCPWAYLRLGQGTTQAFRHLDLWKANGRLALGCDAENAGDAVDGLRAATLFAGLAKDVPMDPTAFGAPDALELLTIRGAEAIGMADRIGSLEVGKQADIVVHDRSGPQWPPVADDVVQQLIWGTDGRSVRDVWVAGEQVVSDGQSTKVEIERLAVDAKAASDDIMRRANIQPAPRWPMV